MTDIETPPEPDGNVWADPSIDDWVEAPVAVQPERGGRDDMWWPVDDSRSTSATGDNRRSLASWAAAGTVAVLLTVGAIVGINTASSNTTISTGRNGQGFPGGGFPGGGGFPSGGFPRNGNGLPGQNSNGLPGQTGNGLPGQTGNGLPGQTGNGLPGQTGNGLPGQNGPGTQGSITAITATGFTLAEGGGQTVRVTTNASTQVITIDTGGAGGAGGQPGALSDLKAGDHVAVVGDTANGTLTASLVLITPN